MDTLIESYEQSLNTIKEMEEKGYAFLYHKENLELDLKHYFEPHHSGSDMYLYINDEDKTYHFYIIP